MTPAAPDALLLIATGCAHCQQVLVAMGDLVKQGRIGRLEVVNIAVSPLPASALEVRSVPWVRIGPFELAGAQTASELRGWAERAEDPAALVTYLTTQLESGELTSTIAACRRHGVLLTTLLSMLGDLETPFAVRIGGTAVVEDLAGDGNWLDDALAREALFALADSPHPQVRADAAHLIGLVEEDDAMALLQRLAEDDDPSVQEIATESLAGRTTAE